MATYTKSVATATDDAIQYASNSAVVTWVHVNAIDATFNYCGLRFTNATIPPGSTVTAATLDITVISGNDDPDIRIHGQDHDNPATFDALTTNDIGGRTRTTAYTTWTDTNLGNGSHTTPDFAAVIQEIVDRPGWSSGNALALILVNDGSSNLYFNGAHQSDPPTLNVTYVTAQNVEESITITAKRAAGAGAAMGVSVGLALGRTQTASGPATAMTTGAAALLREVALLLAVSDSSQKWWEPTGSFTPVGVYRAIGASSSSAARVNLVNPGVNDLTTTAAPSWAVGDGWTLNGTTQFFATGISSDGDYTMIVRFSNAAAPPNDKVLINSAKMWDDGVFLVRVGGALRLKRLQWLADGRVSLISDNPAYQVETIDPDALGDAFVILGHAHTKFGRLT